MNRFYKDNRPVEQMKKGPLGPHIVAYSEHLHAVGYKMAWQSNQLYAAGNFEKAGKPSYCLPVVLHHPGGAHVVCHPNLELGITRPVVGGLLPLCRLLRLSLRGTANYVGNHHNDHGYDHNRRKRNLVGSLSAILSLRKRRHGEQEKRQAPCNIDD